jgi:hypothetical protein
MSTAFTRAAASLALALATFTGQLVDQTTGQPLTSVRVRAAGPGSASATSDAHGRFTLKNLRPGSYTIVVESDDVPQQTFHVTLSGNHPAFTIKACSTTLDYHCATPGGG